MLAWKENSLTARTDKLEMKDSRLRIFLLTEAVIAACAIAVAEPFGCAIELI
jgi:hypothetical protein